MGMQKEVDPNYPPPGDEEVQQCVPQHSDEFGLPPLDDPIGLNEGQPIFQGPPGRGAEWKGPLAAEAAEGPQASHAANNLIIEGIEATQATQFYKSSRHLHAPHSEPDNSVPLIEQKHLAIRVYPDLQAPWWFPGSTVDGGVWFRRIDVSDTYKTAFRLNSPITGRRALSIDRGNRNHTLNFRISDLYTRGRLIVYARVWTDSWGARRYSPWFGRIFNFTAVPHVRIRAHGIHYQRGAINRPAPPLSDFLATGVYLRKTYPMSRFNFVSYDVINFGGDLNDTSGGGCGAGWNALWNQLRALYFATGQDASHYGLMQKGIPTAYGGCGGGNVGASFVGDGSIMAQELGHALDDRRHAPGCSAGDPDPNYPHYSHPSSATIGEYGMDYATGAVYDPNINNDFMGYCPDPWVSPYTYRTLINAVNNQPTPGPAPAGAHAENLRHEENHLYLGFRVTCDGTVELLNGFTAVGPAGRPLGKETPYSVEVHDAAGKFLWAKRLTLEESHQDLNHSHTNYFEAIPMREEARTLVFKCGHHAGATVIEIPEHPPEVAIKSPKGGEGEVRSGKLKLDWVTQCKPDEKVTCNIRYTNNGGQTWQPVAIGLDESELEVDLDRLPSGDDCRLQVVASTILRTATAETYSFVVEKKARQALISPISELSESQPSRHVELAGCAVSGDGCADEEELRWFSNLEGYLGTGTHLIANNLRAGEHVISLVAPDGLGGDGEARTECRVRVLPEA